MKKVLPKGLFGCRAPQKANVARSASKEKIDIAIRQSVV
jgi:hypothetical protein